MITYIVVATKELTANGRKMSVEIYGGKNH